MRRVLFVTGEYPPMPGGVGDYTARLAGALAETGWEPWVMTAPEAQRQTEDAHVLARGERWDWSLARRVREVAREIGADLVHLQYQTGAFAMHPAVNLLPYTLRRQGGPPLLTTFHDLLPPYLFPKAGRLRHGVTELLALGSWRVIATNEADARRLAGSRPVARRLWRIPIGSNLPEPRPFEGAWARERFGLPGGPLVGFFGFLTRDKGFDLLLRALARLPEPRPALVVVGGGLAATDRANAAYRRELGAALELAPLQVVRLGHLPAEDAAAALSAVDVVALPFQEGASLRRGTLVAALRAGLPVLTTDPGPRESLAPLVGGQNLWLVPPGDVDALASGLRTLLGDEALRLRLGQAARTASEPFDWPAIAEQHAALYDEALGAGNSTRRADPGERRRLPGEHRDSGPHGAGGMTWGR